MTASSLLGALALLSSLLSQSLFEHLPAQGGSALALLLSIAQQLPELLFLLRGIDPEDLISMVSAAEAVLQTVSVDGAAAIAETELSEVFGIDLAPTTPAGAVEPQPKAARASAPKPRKGPGVKVKPGRKKFTSRRKASKTTHPRSRIGIGIP